MMVDCVPSMPRPPASQPRIVTANRLADGSVVFLAEAGRWSPELSEAVAAPDEARLAPLLAEAERAVAAREVVGAYAAPVAIEPDGHIAPLGQKERIRAAGPSIPWGVPITRARLES